MKRFLKKRWHGIPIGIVTVFVLAGLVAAGYTFLTHTVEIFVDEPLTIEYNLNGEYGGDWLWHELGDGDSLTLDRSAGDSFEMGLRITNRADNPLTVDTKRSCVPAGGLQWFTFSGWPDGTVDNCPNGPTTFSTTLDVHGDAPVGTYTVTLDFTRS